MSEQHLQEGYTRLSDGRWKITVNHIIPGVTAAMVTYWWGNIDTTDRYKLWHEDHVEFNWEIPPKKDRGYIGAVHVVKEYFNGTPPDGPLTLEITWLDPSKATDATYKNILLAAGKGLEAQEGLLDATLMHEYEDIADGTKMRSHFWLSANAPKAAVEALYLHNKGEMPNFSTFLPWLYWAEVKLPEGEGYFSKGDQRITRESVRASSGNSDYQYWVWTNWQKGISELIASNPKSLIVLEDINLTKWTWHPLSPTEDTLKNSYIV